MKRFLTLAACLLVVLLLSILPRDSDNEGKQLQPRLRPLAPTESLTSEVEVFPVEPLYILPSTSRSVAEIKVELPKLESPSFDFDFQPRSRSKTELWHLPAVRSIQWVSEPDVPNLLTFEVPVLEQSGTNWLPPESTVLVPRVERYPLPDLTYRPRGSSKLRPMSPYCMPGHTSQNFVLYSMHDGLPLHPGVW